MADGPRRPGSPQSPDGAPSPDKRTLGEEGIYLFMEEFTDETCKNAIAFIISHYILDNKLKKLQFMINSPGGALHACFALVDVMKGSKIPIHTIGLGMIASCGIVTFMAGAKGHRYLTPNTSILSHQYSWGSRGKEHELFAVVREFELSTERMLAHYKKCTGLSEKKIRQVLLPPEDIWLSAEEAIKYGIADKIKTVY